MLLYEFRIKLKSRPFWTRHIWNVFQDLWKRVFFNVGILLGFIFCCLLRSQQIKQFLYGPSLRSSINFFLFPNEDTSYLYCTRLPWSIFQYCCLQSIQMRTLQPWFLFPHLLHQYGKTERWSHFEQEDVGFEPRAAWWK